MGLKIRVKVDDFKTFSDLKSYAATKYWKKYNKKDQSEISLLYFEVDSFYDILDDEAFKTFLKGYGKKKTREILVLDGTSEAKRLRKNCNVLRFCTVELNELEGIGETVIGQISGKKKGNFFIASCDEYELEDEVKVEDKEKREKLNKEIRRRNESKISFHNDVQADVKLYEKIAKLWGFSEVEIKKIPNPTPQQLIAEFDKYKNGDHSCDECFIFAFSGHGNITANYQYPDGSTETKFGEYIFLKGDTIVTIHELVEKLKQCKFPTSGPKIMFLDACRGGGNERRYNFINHDNEKSDEDCSEETTTTNMENIILAYSTIPNKVSFCGGTTYGSVFTKCLYTEIEENAKESPIEFHQLLTKVNNLVAREEIYKVEEKNGEETIEEVAQVSCFRSSLCEELYFKVTE